MKLAACPRETQGRVLFDKLRRNEDSQWGKRFDTKNIKGIKTFQKRLPLASYETFSPYIEKLKRGNTFSLLGSGERLLGFGLTSGTTGKPKYIPFTRSFFREYKQGALLFAHRMSEDNPGAQEGKILTVFSPAREYQTEGGFWCGSVSGWIAEHQASVVRSFYAIPSEVLEVKEVEARYYTLMRLALNQTISAFVTANPSTVLTLLKLADEKKTQLVRDIYDGTLCFRKQIPDTIYRAVKSHLKKNPSRARELEDFVAQRGALLPKDYWPRLKLVACWKGGTLFSYVDQFSKYFAESVNIRDIGLLATEGRLSIPLVPHEDAGALAIGSVFFEFIPEEDEGSASPRTLLADEIEKGKKYFLVITTSSGFTRYQINDLVEVVGFLNKTPLIHFLNKGKHFSSLTGEKLSEHQVVTAVHNVSKEFKLHLSHFTLCPCWADVPYYSLLAERNELGEKSVWPKFAYCLDEKLQSLNMEYESKRKTGRLNPIALKVIKDGCFETRKNVGRHLEGRLEQYKHVYLSPAIDYDKQFEVMEVIVCKP